MSCPSGGTPDPNGYLWFDGGTPVGGVTTNQLTLTNITGTHNITATASNSGGTSNTANATVTVGSSGGGLDTSACTGTWGFSNAIVMDFGNLTTIKGALTSSGMGPNTALIIHFNTSTAQSTKTGSRGAFAGVENQATGISDRSAILSTSPCDFNATSPTLGAKAKTAGSTAVSMQFVVNLTGVAPINLGQNKDYYLNVSNWSNFGTPATGGSSNCAGNVCDLKMQITIPK